MAEQSTYRRHIGEDEQLAITLMCVRCNRFRTFLFQENIQLLMEQRWSTIRIQIACVRCGFTMEVRLGWHKPGIGFSTRVVSEKGEVAIVSDEIPMMAEESEDG